MKTTPRLLNWKTTKEDSDLITAIAGRAVDMDNRLDYVQTLMDLTATHANGNPLRLAEMLSAADSFDFLHDVYGIRRNIDRTTGELQNCFIPRFTLMARMKQSEL